MALVRQNLNTFESGEEYLARLEDEADRNFQIFLALLSSYWQSRIDGPMYARMLKAISLEISRIRLSLEAIRNDQTWATTRTEFLYQVVTSMMFPPGSEAVDLHKSDEDFRQFLLQLVELYFAGSVPESMRRIADIITGKKSKLIQNFLEARKPGSGYDISDQFGFSLDIVLSSPGEIDIFLAQRNIRILLDILRPAHTLYTLRFIMKDDYPGPAGPPEERIDTNRMIDAFSFILSNYQYEDFRKFTGGVWRIDPLGTKKSKSVVGEDHSADF